MAHRRPATWRRILAPAALLTAAILAIGGSGSTAAAAQPDGPLGNNGTVKIHDGADEPSAEVRNEPHVCTFHLHFFFADPDQAGTWEIQEWSPGDKGQVVMAGTYDTAGDGEDRQPGTGAYELPDGHYKLFWDGDTGKHDKMKVFWVDCSDTQGGGGGTGGGGDTTGGGGTGSTGGSGGTGGAGGTQAEEQGIGGTGNVLGVSATPPPTDAKPSVSATSSADGSFVPALGLALAGLLTLLLVPRRMCSRILRANSDRH